MLSQGGCSYLQCGQLPCPHQHLCPGQHCTPCTPSCSALHVCQVFSYIQQCAGKRRKEKEKKRNGRKGCITFLKGRGRSEERWKNGKWKCEVRCKSIHLGAFCADAEGNDIRWGTSTYRDVRSANWPALLTSLCMLVPLLSPHSQLTPRTAQMNSHWLCDYWQHHPGIAQRWWWGQAACAIAHAVMFVVSRCLPPCPGEAKLILKANKSSPGLPRVLLCYPPAAGVNAAVSGCQVALVGQQPFAYPQCRVGARLHRGSLPLNP